MKRVLPLQSVRNVCLSMSLGALLAAPAYGQSNLAFAPAVSYSVGAQPSHVATGDVNGDGVLDLATANQIGGSISVLLGRSDGGFHSAIDYPVGFQMDGIAAADFNGDGRDDLAATKYNPHTVWTFLSGAGGALGAGVSYGVSGHPQGIAAADISGDGLVDLVVPVGQSTGGVLIMLGDGAGTFQAPVQYGNTPAREVAIGDFNSDGFSDLAVTTYDGNTVPVFRGNGDGTFQPALSFAAGNGTSGIAAADLDGDGILDLAVADYDTNSFVAILRGNGNGTFQSPLFYPVGSASHSVAVADLNGDGFIDLVVDNGNDGTVSVLLGSAGGTFQRVDFAVGANPQQAIVRDLNGDGRPDVVVACGSGSNSVWVFLNSSTGFGNDAPPTAVAGPDQAIHASGTVYLDGSDSFDDNTASVDLSYSWSLVARPSGSNAILSGSTSPSASFSADLPGTYLVELVVRDGRGQASAPDEVVISSTNLSPTADAGTNRVVLTGTTVVLSGAASSDPEMDSLTYRWTWAQRPAGSAAVLVDDHTIAPSFVPDTAGDYVAELVVDDGFGPSPPDSVLTTAITGQQFVENTVMSVAEAVAALPPELVTTTGNQQALGNFLTQVIQSVRSNNLAAARMKLEMAIGRTDGCARRGRPDATGPGRDWILDCPAQAEAYDQLVAALDAISP